MPDEIPRLPEVVIAHLPKTGHQGRRTIQLCYAIDQT